jgi:plastocyanin
MRKVRPLLIALAGITLIAASCGDDDDNGSAATTVVAGGASTPSASTASSGTTAGTESSATTEGGETTPGSAPVSLEGQLNNKGTKEVTGDEVDLEMDDYYFEPTFIKASPGATIHVKLENESDDTHTFTIDALGIDQEVAAGKDATVDVKLPESGAVRFYCRFHGSMGMQGAFFFKEGDQVVTGTTGG